MTTAIALPGSVALGPADHVMGPSGTPVVLQYGDFLCPRSRAAYRSARNRAGADEVQFAFRHFPMIARRPHTLSAARAAEAAALQDSFWPMADLLFERQASFVVEGPRPHAAELGLDLDEFDEYYTSEQVLDRVRRDMRTAMASPLVTHIPTVLVDGERQDDDHAARGCSRALVRKSTCRRVRSALVVAPCLA